MTVQQTSLQKLLAAKLRLAQTSQVAQLANPAPAPQVVTSVDQLPKPAVKVPLQDKVIEFNEKQREGIEAICSGQSVAITGAAGCGKTTLVKGAMSRLVGEDIVGQMDAADHKYLPATAPAIALISFTNKAVTNIKKVLPLDLRGNALTAHKLLEFEPTYFDVWDEKAGKYKTTMRFEPTRNKQRPIPVDMQILFIDEAPMMAVDLWNMIADAISPKAKLQIVLIGDIQQLPPVFGKSIYIHAVEAGMRVVELTEVYRQALNSPIISLATEIVAGRMIPAPKLQDWAKQTEDGKVFIQPWKKSLSDIAAVKVMSMWLPEQIDKGAFNPKEDVILTPYNVNFGTEAFNNIVAAHVARKEEAEVWEIYAGIKKKYFRVGERVLYNKSDGVVISISPNKNYIGKIPRGPSKTMNYEGMDSKPPVEVAKMTQDEIDNVDFMLTSFASHREEGESLSRQASHVIKVFLPDLGQEVELTTGADIAALALGYAITVHKSQGSEYRKVFFLTHKSQATMIFRELVYTAVTRAKEELIIVCEPNLFVAGVNSQRLVGNTVAEKIKNFKRYMEVNKIGDSELPRRMDLFLPKTNKEIAK